MKTILVTFAGRKKFLEILFKYIKKYEKYIDEYHIYVSTNVVEDIEFIKEFKKENEQFVKLFYREYPEHNLWNQAWKNSQKDDEVYIKLDDDIVYLDETLFTNFLNFRKENTQYPFIYPMIINNYYCSWLLQENFDFVHTIPTNFGKNWENYKNVIFDYINNRRDSKIEIRYFDSENISPFRVSQIIPEKITDLISESNVFCPLGWSDMNFCKNLHDKFILDIENKNLFSYTKQNDDGVEITNFAPISINCVSWIGRDLKKITSEFGDIWQDEPWVSIYCPIMTNKNNFVYYGSVVSHFSYYKQSQLGIDNTNILDKYREICYNLCES
jgi:hypothetical protein